MSSVLGCISEATHLIRRSVTFSVTITIRLSLLIHYTRFKQ
jgi:hypothetical protein